MCIRDSFQIGRAIRAVMAVWRPARPGAARHVDFKEDQAFGQERWRKNVIDLALGRAATADFALNLVGSNQANPVFARGRRAADGKFKRALRCNPVSYTHLDVYKRQHLHPILLPICSCSSLRYSLLERYAKMKYS